MDNNEDDLLTCDTCEHRLLKNWEYPCCFCYGFERYEPIKGDDEE